MFECYICGGNKFVDKHHYDCHEGKISPETVPLCRRCHRTYHDLGVEYFDDEFLDKAIEIENKRRVLLGKPNTYSPLKREDVHRSYYFNKSHGIKDKDDRKGAMTPAFKFHLPHGEPLCGWDWVNAHLYDLMTWVPRIEVTYSGCLLISENIDNTKKLKEVSRSLRGMRSLC